MFLQASVILLTGGVPDTPLDLEQTPSLGPGADTPPRPGADTHPPWTRCPPPPGPGTPPWEQKPPPPLGLGPGAPPRTRYPGPGTPQDQVHPRDQVHPPGPGTPPWEQKPPPPTPLGPGTPSPDQVHPPGPGTPPGTRYTPPDAEHAGDMVNERAVRILLECNLVVPPVTSQSLSFLSDPPVAKTRPDGLHRTQLTSPSWPSWMKTIKQIQCAQLPYLLPRKQHAKHWDTLNSIR